MEGNTTDPRARHNEIMGRLRGYRESSVLIAFAELGIGDTIASGCRTPEEIAGRIGADAGATGRFLRAAEAFGLLRHDAGGYVNTDLAAETLTSAGAASLVNLVRWEARFYRRWTHLAEAVRSGRRPEANRRDEDDPSWVPDFTRAFLDVARLSAPAVARAMASLVPADQPARVVDVGGGHGGYSIALAEAYPNVSAVVFDLPPVIATTREIVAASRVTERVTTLAGDFRSDSIGAGYDIALLFGVLVGGDAETGRRLLRTVRAALVPGGHVVVRATGGSAVSSEIEQALGDLHMLLSTDAGAAHGSADVTAWIVEAGFEVREPLDLPPPATGRLLLGRKQD